MNEWMNIDWLNEWILIDWMNAEIHQIHKSLAWEEFDFMHRNMSKYLLNIIPTN